MNGLQILLNGNEEILEKSVSLTEFLEAKGMDLATIIVEYNEEIIKQETWSSVILENNDRLEVLKFVGGG